MFVLLCCFVLFLGPLFIILCGVLFECFFLLCVAAVVVLCVLSLLLRVVFV